MRRTRPGRVFVVLLAACLAPVALPVRADVYMRQKRHTGAYTVRSQTSPERTEIWVYWLGKGRARVDRGEGKSTLILFEEGIIRDLDHSSRTFVETPMVAGKAPPEDGKGRPGLAAGSDITPLGSVSAAVTMTSDTKNLRGWRCRKYLLEIKIPLVESRSEAWVTEDLKIDPDLYLTSVYAMLASQRGFPEMIREMRKLKGVVVFESITATMMGSEVLATQEVLEFGSGTPPPEIYRVPSGYAKAKSPIAGGQRPAGTGCAPPGTRTSPPVLLTVQNSPFLREFSKLSVNY